MEIPSHHSGATPLTQQETRGYSRAVTLKVVAMQRRTPSPDPQSGVSVKSRAII